MGDAGLDGLVITNPINFKYFTGVRSEFLVPSPTRPWYLLIPRDGDPIAVVSNSGRVAMEATTSISDVRTWPSPRWADEGLTLVTDAIQEMARETGRIGWELGPETRLGIPSGDFLTLADRAAHHKFVDASAVIRALRMVKSPAEIEALRRICQITSDGYDAIPELYEAGGSLAQLLNRFRLFVLGRGASHAPFIAATADSPCIRAGHEILTPTDRLLSDGDILFIDSGFTLDGYHSDFNRNWAVRHATTDVQRAYEHVFAATEVGIKAARAGVRVADVFDAMASYLRPYGEVGSPARMGHGLGLALTEPPSVTSYEDVVLSPGMVVTIEPTLMLDDARLMMHEEVIVVTDDAPELLTRRASPEILVLSSRRIPV